MLTLADIWSFPIFPDRASTGAARIDAVYFGLTAFSVGIVALLVFLIAWFGIKYRAGSKAVRSQRESVRLYEITWTSALTLVGIGLFAWASEVFFDVTIPPADARTIYIVGKQWMWKAEHPSGRREINELHVPVGEPIRLLMTSQDVIHSYFIPAFRTKQDVLPDRYTTLWFQPTKPGAYHLFCAEYCGAGHSVMRGTVYVMPERDFEQWLGESPSGDSPIPGTPGTPNAPLALGGRGIFFQLGCNACHIPTNAVRAPRLDGLFGNQTRLANGETIIADENYIRESILDPNAKIVAGYAAPSLMPTYRGQITADQLNELLEFIKSIRDGWPADMGGPAEPVRGNLPEWPPQPTPAPQNQPPPSQHQAPPQPQPSPPEPPR